MANYHSSGERVTGGCSVWSEEGCKKVSKRGHLKAGPQGEWALVGVQGKHATSFEDVKLPGGSRAHGVD